MMWDQGPVRGLICNSDRGTQYASPLLQEKLFSSPKNERVNRTR